MAGDLVDTMQRSLDEVLDALEDMTLQHCFLRPDGSYDSMALSANEDALDVLVAYRPERWRWEKGAVGRARYTPPPAP